MDLKEAEKRYHEAEKLFKEAYKVLNETYLSELTPQIESAKTITDTEILKEKLRLMPSLRDMVHKEGLGVKFDLESALTTKCIEVYTAYYKSQEAANVS